MIDTSWIVKVLRAIYWKVSLTKAKILVILEKELDYISLYIIITPYPTFPHYDHVALN